MTADDPIPALSDALDPPSILGAADLTHFAYAGHDLAALIGRVEHVHSLRGHPAARLHDMATAEMLGFHRALGLDLQDRALEVCTLCRVRPGPEFDAPSSPRPLRVLALTGPGDLMANTPLDFLTNHLDVRLDLLTLLPGRTLPPVIPDHDVAFFAQGEADAATLDRLRRLFAAWPRPALNNPALLPLLARDRLCALLAGIPSIRSPTAAMAPRAALEALLADGAPLPGLGARPYPFLARPAGSHAGHGLKRIAAPDDLREFLAFSFDREFCVTAFEDYRSADGLHRKYRVAFVAGRPYLCHMALSTHWMVHYLNGGMSESAEKRAAEAAAMEGFDTGFARRHRHAFAELARRIPLDLWSIDCGETADGRLLVFEADSAAIIHLMDPPDLFPYKQPAMRRVFAAFEALLRSRAEPA